MAGGKHLTIAYTRARSSEGHPQAVSAPTSPRHPVAQGSLAEWDPAYLHGHDGAALGMPHLLYHPIGSTSQFRDGHQVIGLHLKVLGGQKERQLVAKRQELAM